VPKNSVTCAWSQATCQTTAQRRAPKSKPEPATLTLRAPCPRSESRHGARHETVERRKTATPDTSPARNCYEFALNRDAWPGHDRIHTQEESRDEAHARLLVSTLRRNRRPPRRPGHRLPLVLVPPPVTNLGEVAATIPRPARPLHGLWLPRPGRRRPPAPPQWRLMMTAPTVDPRAV
jgi:hypothetical protein